MAPVSPNSCFLSVQVTSPSLSLPPSVYAGQQVRVLGESYTLEDEEDSKIAQVQSLTLYFKTSLEQGFTVVLSKRLS